MSVIPVVKFDINKMLDEHLNSLDKHPKTLFHRVKDAVNESPWFWRKIVISGDYGGFFVPFGILREYYRRKSGVKLYLYKQTKYDFKDGVDVYTNITPDGDLSDLPTMGTYISALNQESLGVELFENYISQYSPDISREDPILIDIVEHSTKNGSLKVVKIPRHIKYEIEEYDGNEWVFEKHRRWS